VACGARAALAVADVLRDHVAKLRLTPEQAKATAHILACRTGRLGGHRALCDRCGYVHFAYHSCRDRHCPRCGSLDQALWAEAQIRHLLPINYFHLVFTIPASLRPFFNRAGRKLALDALFAAVSETILEVAARRGLRLGILVVLHTWTQQLGEHPHLHCLVTGGGLRQDGFLHKSRFLFSYKVLRYVFKIKLLQRLRRLVKQGKLSVGRHSAYELLRDADSRTWNVDVRRPLAGPEQVVRYFARYTRRIAISDRRLLSYDGNKVTFRYRDRSDNNRAKPKTLDRRNLLSPFPEPRPAASIRPHPPLRNPQQPRATALAQQVPRSPRRPGPAHAHERVPNRRLLPHLRRRSRALPKVPRRTTRRARNLARHSTPARCRPRPARAEGTVNVAPPRPRAHGQHGLASTHPSSGWSSVVLGLAASPADSAGRQGCFACTSATQPPRFSLPKRLRTAETPTTPNFE